MNLFEIKDSKLTYAPQALALKPFKVLWNADKTKGKDNAINELCYVYHMADHKSDFSGIADNDKRSKEIITAHGFKPGWKPSKKVLEAIDFYRERSETISSRLLKTAKISVAKIEEFISTVGITDANMKKIFDNTKQLHELADSIEKLEEQINKQQNKKTNARGSIEKSEFEDGF